MATFRAGATLRHGQANRAAIGCVAAIGRLAAAAERGTGITACAGTEVPPLWAAGAIESGSAGSRWCEAGAIATTATTRQINWAAILLGKTSKNLAQANSAVAATLTVATLQSLPTTLIPAGIGVAAVVGVAVDCAGSGGRATCRTADLLSAPATGA